MNDTLPKAALDIFKDWLIDNVDFIRIVAQTEQDAHKIFVSMNDRGLSLTPTEMLKGYLLSKIENDSVRQQANDLWKKRILELKGLGKEEESDFIKNWIRSQYAETIRERKKNALPGDFDIIGTAFHKWVREHNTQMKLVRSKDFEDFVLKQFDKFSQIYLDLKKLIHFRIKKEDLLSISVSPIYLSLKFSYLYEKQRKLKIFLHIIVAGSIRNINFEKNFLKL
jgi:uncharacterized protein with ParB-like and HNH nuclease domain